MQDKERDDAGEYHALPNRAWPNLMQILGHTIRSTEY
jgi:hypothetical protein